MNARDSAPAASISFSNSCSTFRPALNLLDANPFGYITRFGLACRMRFDTEPLAVSFFYLWGLHIGDYQQILSLSFTFNLFEELGEELAETSFWKWPELELMPKR